MTPKIRGLLGFRIGLCLSPVTYWQLLCFPKSWFLLQNLAGQLLVFGSMHETKESSSQEQANNDLKKPKAEAQIEGLTCGFISAGKVH